MAVENIEETGALLLIYIKLQPDLALKVLNFKMDCSNFEIWPVYMNYRGKFHLKFIYNKQSRPLMFAKVYQLGSSTVRVKLVYT